MQNLLVELHYLPSIQYFSKLLAYPSVIIDQHEHYSKGSYRNRTHIASANGLLRLGVPLQKGKNQQQSIREVKISYQEAWHKQHWKTIQSAYGNAPFFEFYSEELAAIYTKKPTFLFDFNLELIETIADCLGLDLNIKFSETYHKTPPKGVLDLRNTMHPKPRFQKIDPHFQQKKYVQLFEDAQGFFPNLSVLDLLFCTGPQAAIILEDVFCE